MTRLSTLPSTREQARHALLLLGVPAPVRLVVDVHSALFDGDLSVPALAALIRDEERVFAPATGPDGPATALPRAEAGGHGGTGRHPYLICPGLNLDLSPVRGLATLSTWTVADRICTPAVARAEALAAIVRVAEFATGRPGACAAWLMRQLAASVPGGWEALDVLNPDALGDAARAALDDPGLAAAVAAEAPAREVAAARAAALDERQRLFGALALPHQRDGA